MRVHGAKAKGGRARQLAPGMLERHYSPRTPLVFAKIGAKAGSGDPALQKGTAVIRLRRPAGKPAANVYWLSEQGALSEIARNLYGVLRLVDAGGYQRIVIEPVSADLGGLATAINDRLKRAAAKR